MSIIVLKSVAIEEKFLKDNRLMSTFYDNNNKLKIIMIRFSRSFIQNTTLNSVIMKRYAGGGGRPGGKPTFNWKQKKALGLDKPKLKPFKIRPEISLFDDIAPYFDPSRGDLIVPIGDNFREPPYPYKNVEEIVDNQKKIKISRLFGSNKPSGMIVFRDSKFKGYRSTKRTFPGKRKLRRNILPNIFVR